jgi:hypothetical protein
MEDKQPKIQAQQPLPAPLGSEFDGYQPEMWTVPKDAIYAAIPAVESGLEYARECLAEHDRALGRTTYKNKTWVETMEGDIRQMEAALKLLRSLPQSSPVERQKDFRK